MTYPQQGFQPQAQPVQQPTFTPPQYAAPYNAPAQQFQPGPSAPPAPAGPAPAQGSLGQGWDQGARSGGHGGAAKFPQQGSVFSGFLARDMVNADCRQAREPSKDGTGPLKFFRKSGQPQFEYTIPCNVQPSQEFPDGKATLFTSKYRLHSAVVRAMIEQGYQAGEPLREGDFLEVQRIADVPSGFGQPAQDFVARITRRENLGGGGGGISPTSATPQVEYAAPVQAAPAVNQQTGQAVQLNGYADPTVVTVSAPAQVPVTQAVPVATASPIPGLTPEQAALVAQYHGNQQQG